MASLGRHFDFAHQSPQQRFHAVLAGCNSIEGENNSAKHAADMIQRENNCLGWEFFVLLRSRGFVIFFSTCQTLKCLLNAVLMCRCAAQSVCVCVWGQFEFFCSFSMLDLQCCDSFRCWEREAEGKRIRKGYLIAVQKVAVLRLLHQDSIKTASYVNSLCLIVFPELDEKPLWPGNRVTKLKMILFSLHNYRWPFWKGDTCWN